MNGIGLVHPAVPRVGQGVTAALAVAFVLTGAPAFLIAALVLVVGSLVAPRHAPVAWVVRRLVRPADELEPVAPVRFSQYLAVGFLGVAAALSFGGLALPAMVVAGLVAALALLSATTGLCVGCEVYRVLLALRRGGGDVRVALGLGGPGPWLVVLTAPGCARCEPVARALERAAEGREVVRVNLRDRPGAAVVPVKSVPAVLLVASDGRIQDAWTGTLDAPTIAEVVGAVPVAAG